MTTGTIGSTPGAAGPARSTTRIAIAVMLVGMLMFSLNDAMGKWLVSTYSVGQVLLIRSAAAMVFLTPFLWRDGVGPLFSVERPGLQALRVLFSSAEVYCFYFAVIALPLADVMTYWLAAPIYVAGISPFLLGERVGWRRWVAILVGFLGVVVALEPSAASFTAPALVSILGSFCFAFMMLSGRVLRGTPDRTLVFWQIVGAGLFGLVTAPFGWVSPSAFDLSLLALLGVVAMAAHLCVNRALKLADASIVAPFQYTLLIWAVILGFVFFDDVPRPGMLAGAAIIVAAGWFIAVRERRARG